MATDCLSYLQICLSSVWRRSFRDEVRCCHVCFDWSIFASTTNQKFRITQTLQWDLTDHMTLKMADDSKDCNETAETLQNGISHSDDDLEIGEVGDIDTIVPECSKGNRLWIQNKIILN